MDQDTEGTLGWDRAEHGRFEEFAVPPEDEVETSTDDEVGDDVDPEGEIILDKLGPGEPDRDQGDAVIDVSDVPEDDLSFGEDEETD